jgi:hypothetical protein
LGIAATTSVPTKEQVTGTVPAGERADLTLPCQLCYDPFGDTSAPAL